MKKKKKRERKKEFRGKGKKKKKDKKKNKNNNNKNLLLALNRSGYFCWCPVCATGGGGWKDWFHFSPFLGHSLRCFVGVVPGSQSGR